MFNVSEQDGDRGGFKHIEIQNTQYFVQRMLQIQPLLHDRDQHIGGDGDPQLRLHGVLGRAQEGLDPQVLLDPFEEQLHLPALLVQGTDRERGQRQFVGQELECLARLGVDEGDATQWFWISLARVDSGEADMVIADQPGACVHGKVLNQPGLHVALGAGHKESPGCVQTVQPGEVHVGLVHHVKRANLDVALLAQEIEHVDIVHQAIADVNETGDRTSQVQQGVQLDSRFGGTKRSPRKKAQAQVDGGRVQRVNRRPHQRLQLCTGRVVGVQRSGDTNQVMRQIGKDLPGAYSIGVGQRVARDGLAAKSEVIEMLALRPQIDLDVAQGFASCELGKGQAQELIQTSEVFDFVLGAANLDHASKGLQRQVSHNLRKNELTRMNVHPRQLKAAKHGPCLKNYSNRGQPKNGIYANESSTYELWA